MSDSSSDDDFLIPTKTTPQSCSEERNFSCQFCFKEVSSRTTLSRHENICAKNPLCEDEKFCCPCGCQFNRNDYFTNHLKNCTKTSDEIQSMSFCMYNDCDQKFREKAHLIQHLNSVHKSLIREPVRMSFSSYKEFVDWKDIEQNDSFSEFAAKSEKRGSQYLYHCQRDGQTYTLTMSGGMTRKRNRSHLKERKKIGKNCIAKITVKVDESGSVDIVYYPIHSHPLSPEHLEFQRRTEKEIRNKARRLRDKIVYSRSDLTSITGHLLEKDPGVILIYKPFMSSCVIGPKEIDSLPESEELFMFGLQTTEQRKLMLQGSKKILIVDDTHYTIERDYRLLSMMVTDDLNRGWAVGHLITNKTDELTLNYFFKALKERCPELLVNCVITKNDPAIIKSMTSGLVADIRHILCRWHVGETLKNQLCSLSPHNMIEEMYTALMEIRDAKTKTGLEQLTEEFSVKYGHVATEFVSYFKRHYYQNDEEISKWAMCYRDFPHSTVDTTCHVESFHNRVKSGETKTRTNKCVDDLVRILLRFENYDFCTRENEKINDEVKVSSQSMNSRHLRGITIGDENIKVISRNLWEVRSQTDAENIYVVTKCVDECTSDSDMCSFKCEDPLCSTLCSHMYLCTCPDQYPLCKHIHKVHSRLSRGFVIFQLKDVSLGDKIRCSSKPDTDVLEPEGIDLQTKVRRLEGNLSKLGSMLHQLPDNVLQHLPDHLLSEADTLVVELLGKCETVTRMSVLVESRMEASGKIHAKKVMEN